MDNYKMVHINQRMTRQRRVILEEIGKTKSHPTADEIYDLVRNRLPRISLGTVYRNLELLAESGKIRVLQFGGQKRFDGNVNPHYHFRCVECGGLTDAPIKPRITIQHPVGDVDDYCILGHRFEFIGICPTCKMNQSIDEIGDIEPAGKGNDS